MLAQPKPQTFPVILQVRRPNHYIQWVHDLIGVKRGWQQALKVVRWFYDEIPVTQRKHYMFRHCRV